MFGLPTEDARDAAANGELLLRGCMMPDDAPQWACGGGHEWSTSDPHWGAAIDAVVLEYAAAALTERQLHGK